MSYVMVYHKDADHSLHMAVSDDSYSWRAVNGDKPVVKGNDIPWSEVGCTWAPELVWDDAADCFFMHFTTRFGRGMNQIYGVHLKRDLTGLKEWKPIGYFNDRGSPMKREGFSEQKHGAIVEASASLARSLERYYNEK